MSQYYTPEIEEFHVGFEYEEFHDMTRYRIDDERYKRWNKKTVSSPVSRDNLYVGVNGIPVHLVDSEFKEYVRVKRLDQEDIESLGFRDEGDGRMFSGKIMMLTEGNGDRTIKQELPYTWKGTNYVDYRTLFSGFIKNKSELKRILKQIGI